MRIVLSSLGTYGDIHPLIALAVELKRRGHVPVMALQGVYEPKIKPLGIEFHAVRPDIDPKNTILVEMIYDVKKGTERGLRDFLFPALRQTYDDLLDAVTKPVRAELMLLGELNYAGPIVAELTGIPWASYLLAPLSFFSAFDPPVRCADAVGCSRFSTCRVSVARRPGPEKLPHSSIHRAAGHGSSRCSHSRQVSPDE